MPRTSHRTHVKSGLLLALVFMFGTEVRERQDTDRFSRLPPSIFIEESDADPSSPSTHRRLNDGLLLMLCVLGTLLFFPFGLLAFYQLFKARTLFKEGKIPTARTRAFYAQILSLLAVLFGMVWVGLAIGLTV